MFFFCILRNSTLTEGIKKVYTRFKEKVFLTLREKKIVIYENEYNKSIFYMPMNCILYVKPGRKVFSRQVIAEKLDFNMKSKFRKSKENENLTELKDIKLGMSGEIYRMGRNLQKDNKLFWILNANVMTFQSFFINFTSRFHFKLKTFTITQRLKKKELYFNKEKNFFKKKFPGLTITTNNIYSFMCKSKKLRDNKYIIVTSIFEKEKVILVEKSKKRKSVLGCFKVGHFVQKNGILNCYKFPYSSQVIEERKNFSVIRKVSSYYLDDELITKMSKLPFVSKNYLLYSTILQKQKTKDIVQGLPLVEQLFEARESSLFRSIKNNPSERLEKNFILFKEKHSNLIAVRKSLEIVQKYVIRGIQEVYESQGVKISDKHIEVIVKQMTSKVIITNSGDSCFMVGDFLDLNQVEIINESLTNKIIYEPLIMGITRSSLSNQSFIAQASFQETTKVLTRSALQGRVDWLYGLKENLVLGNIIPAGTGFKN